MRKRPRQQRSRALVKSLVEATGRVIVAGGPELTTTNHIADEAGVDIASLYQYFANKDDLSEALVESLADDIAATATRHFTSIDMFGVTPAELIRSALALGLELARANPVLRELARDSRYLFGSHGLGVLENRMQLMATAYFRHHVRSYPVENLHIRLHIVSISAFTIIVRHFTEEVPLVRDDVLIEEMVTLFAPYFAPNASAAT